MRLDYQTLLKSPPLSLLAGSAPAYDNHKFNDKTEFSEKSFSDWIRKTAIADMTFSDQWAVNSRLAFSGLRQCCFYV